MLWHGFFTISFWKRICFTACGGNKKIKAPPLEKWLIVASDNYDQDWNAIQECKFDHAVAQGNGQDC
jgi:hypothetical protein